MPSRTSGDLKDESLLAKKSLETEGCPEKPSEERKCSRHLRAMGSRECTKLPAHRSLLHCGRTPKCRVEATEESGEKEEEILR